MQQGRSATPASSALGLGANLGQFLLLVAINAFVGAMVGVERSVLPLLAEEEFGVTSAAVVSAFVGGFGLAKAIANLFAGAIAERITRRRTLILGWLFGIPVPFMIIWAPAWEWIIAANLLLGINQGLAWSMTVNMKVDLVGPQRRGLALGANETAGYLAVALFAFLSGVVAENRGLRPEPFYLGIAVVAVGTALSVLFVRDTSEHVRYESRVHADGDATPPSFRRAFAEGTWGRPKLASYAQGGFVTNLNDAVAWAIFPIYFAAKGRSIDEIAILAAAYPLAWGALQVPAGWFSDRAGRVPMIVAGFAIQAAGTGLVLAGPAFGLLLVAALILGTGKAFVYPTLQAAVSDAVHPAGRPSFLGVYRFWRDAGALGGAVGAGVAADIFGQTAAIGAVAIITLGAGVVIWITERRQSSPVEGTP